MKEDEASWDNFFIWLKERGLDGVKLVVEDKCLGTLEAVGKVFPNAKYQRCVVHFYRKVFSVVPKSKSSSSPKYSRQYTLRRVRMLPEKKQKPLWRN